MNLIGLNFLGFLLFFQTQHIVVPVRDAINLIPRDSTVVVTNTTVTVTGVVTTPSPTPVSMLGSYIQDKTGGIKLFQLDYRGSPLRVGDSVIATGRLGLFKGQEELQEPEIRILKKSAQVSPASVTASEIASGEFEGRLVRMKGTVLRKQPLRNGTILLLRDMRGDTVALYSDNYAVSTFAIDQIHRDDVLLITGVGSRYTTNKPYLDGNEIYVRFPSDIVLSGEDLFAHYFPDIFIIAIIAGGILIVLLIFNYLLRSEVKQKTKQIKEQARLSAVLYNSIAELDWSLDRDEIIRRVVKQLGPYLGSSSALFCESASPDEEWTVTIFRLTNGEIDTEVKKLKSDFLVRTMERLAGKDALWNLSLDDFVPTELDLTKEETNLLGLLKKPLPGKKITVVSPLSSNPKLFAIFDHTMAFSEGLDQALILSYIRHLHSTVRAAELFALTKKQEAEIEKLYNNSVLGLLTLSSDGTIETANRVASEMLNDKTLVSKKIQDYLAVEDARRLSELLPSLATIATEKFVRFEAKVKRDYAAISEVEFAMEFDRDSKKFHVSVQDIGDRRIFEDYAAYEQKIETLEKLASFLSHDLNNIVGSIMGYASLLKRKLQLESKEYHYANIIEDSSKRTTELVKQVLGFAQMDTTTIEVVDLNGFVHDIASDFEKTHDKKYSVLMAGSNQPIYTRVSTSQFKQVLLTILENAAESMESGGIIRCSIGFSDVQGAPAGFVSRGRQCYIEIEDHGVGMDEAIKRRIFEPFFTTKRIKKYTGLSLSAAFNIIKHHKGFISIDSTPGVGTKVRVHLPLYSEKESSKGETVSPVSFGVKGTKVLVVDDEESVRQLGFDILSEHGYTVMTASDGLQALECLRENPDVRLVVLDMVMPVMGGKDACIEIKKLPKPPKVLICTGFSELSDLETILGIYAEGLLQKPYSTGDLITSVGNLLKSTPSERT